MYKYYILAGLCFLLASCNADNAAQERSEIQYKGDTIMVSKASTLEHITTQKVEKQSFSEEFKTVGTVRPVSGKLAEIAPPVAGRIGKSFVRLGQKVNAGESVFELSSADFFEATKAYFAARSGSELATRNYNRQKELAANGVAAQRDLEEAQSEALIARQEFEQAGAILRMYNINEKILKPGEPLKVVTPIGGEVVKCDVTIGSYAREDAEPLVVVADLSSVWVVALVKEKYFGSIGKGDKVEVFTDAHPDKTVWGTIYHIGEMLDEETRALEVIVACDNAERSLKPGMFCEIHFLSAPTEAILLPSTAIMQEQDNDYLLVEVSKGTFVRRRVETKTVDLNNVRVVSGVTEGERVVTKGGIYLNM